MGCILMPKAKASSSLSSSPPVHGRSVYIHKALADPSLVGQAKEMKELYTKQVRSEVAKGHVVPERSCATPSGPGVVALRIVQWNLNCLCGIDGQSPQRAADVIKVLAPCNADVLVLQEMPRGPAQSWWWEPWRSTFPAEEMRALETGLQELGYQTQLRSSCFSSTLLCTRLTVVAVSEASLDSEHDFRMPEDRAALLVSLRLEADADSLIVTICATHFHHQNFTVNDKGVRKAEAELLLRHCATNTPSDSQCTLMVADFNQARRGDYSAEEWSVISAGLHSIKEPEDDGVAELLTSQGWVCAYDIAAERNWRGASPPFTHWTGTTVDYTYMLAPADRAKVSAHLLHSDVSDHLPIMTHVSF